MTPIDFCPAAAAATEVARLEAYLALVHRGLDQAARAVPATPLDLLQRMEEHAGETAQLVDAARDRLAQADPVSATGAIAQLLAAIRDLRVDDDAERARAAELEVRARAFLGRSRLMRAEVATGLSQTRPAVI